MARVFHRAELNYLSIRSPWRQRRASVLNSDFFALLIPAGNVASITLLLTIIRYLFPALVVYTTRLFVPFPTGKKSKLSMLILFVVFITFFFLLIKQKSVPCAETQRTL